MSTNEKKQCKHEYIVGYQFRIPQPFFRSLPCDNCGCKIQLSLPWRIMFLFANILGYIVAFCVSTAIHIKILGSTLYISLIIFILLIWVFQLVNRLVLKFGKWVEVELK